MATVIKAQEQKKPTARVQQVAQPAKVARGVQSKSGVLDGQTKGGVFLQLTQRKDGRVYYQQLKALKQQADRAATPARQAIFAAAHARMKFFSSEEANNTTIPPDVLVSHPLVGHQPILADGGASAHTQVMASLQYWHRNSAQYSEQVNNPNSVLGPKPKRKPIPYQGNSLNLRTVTHPHGYTPVRRVKPTHASMSFKPDAAVLVKHKATQGA